LLSSHTLLRKIKPKPGVSYLSTGLDHRGIPKMLPPLSNGRKYWICYLIFVFLLIALAPTFKLLTCPLAVLGCLGLYLYLQRSRSYEIDERLHLRQYSFPWYEFVEEITRKNGLPGDDALIIMNTWISGRPRTPELKAAFLRKCGEVVEQCHAKEWAITIEEETRKGIHSPSIAQRSAELVSRLQTILYPRSMSEYQSEWMERNHLTLAGPPRAKSWWRPAGNGTI